MSYGSVKHSEHEITPPYGVRGPEWVNINIGFLLVLSCSQLTVHAGRKLSISTIVTHRVHKQSFANLPIASMKTRCWVSSFSHSTIWGVTFDWKMLVLDYYVNFSSLFLRFPAMPANMFLPLKFFPLKNSFFQINLYCVTMSITLHKNIVIHVIPCKIFCLFSIVHWLLS